MIENRTIQVINRYNAPLGSKSSGPARGGPVRFLNMMAVGLSMIINYARLERELRNLSDKMVIPENGGVLLCITIREWELADATGNANPQFDNVCIVGSGINRQGLVQEFHDRNREQLYPKGIRFRFDYFFKQFSQDAVSF